MRLEGVEVSEEILRFVDTIHRDRQVSKEVIFTGIELALISAAQKSFDQEEGIEVNIDRDSGTISAARDGEGFDPRAALGRIAAGAGKQVLFQKIREAEREVIYKEYVNRVGEMFNGTVASRKGGGLVITLGNRAEGFMPRGEQSHLEEWKEGDRIRVVLKEVNLQPTRVQLLVSRGAPDLVRRLFEQEIPEVADYVVEIKAVAREAGNRSKVAVSTLDSNVDCVGACIGVKGSRIRNVTDELSGEKIKEMFDYLKRGKAHPISHMQLIIDKNHNIKKATIGGKPIVDTETYFIATNDYLQQGGDGMVFLGDPISLEVLDYKVRSVLIDYFNKHDTIAPVRDDRFIKQ